MVGVTVGSLEGVPDCFASELALHVLNGSYRNPWDQSVLSKTYQE